MTEKGSINIQAKNIFPIIKKWLYSEQEIFLRELVSNSIDAITKVKVLINDGKLKDEEEEFSVKVKILKDENKIIIEDNGLGMTSEEIAKYLGQMAFSGAEDFIKQYEGGSEGIIGHFGLGFYSCFMVSDKVEVDTKSWVEDSKAVKWTCEGDPEYTIDDGERETRGTTITLFVAEDEKQYLEEWKLKEILKKYCRFMPFPIYLGEEIINPDQPIWVKSAKDLKDEDYLEFYKTIYPHQADPHFWIHINADFPFKLQGVLYFPKMENQIDIKTDQLNLYCNRVFVSNEMNVLLPESLKYIKGFLDSSDIPLNVSRSFLQQDSRVRKISAHLTRKIADRLVEIMDDDAEKFYELWKDIHLYIKIICMRDEKFAKRVKKALLFEQNNGGWVNIEDILTKTYGENWEKSEESKHIYYGVKGETLNSIINLYGETPVILATPPIDSHYFHYYEGFNRDKKIEFKRVDSELGVELLAEAPNEIVDTDGNTSKDRIINMVKEFLPDVTIKAEWLKKDSLPLVLIFPEFERRFREITQSMNDPKDTFGTHDCILNLNHSLISRIDPKHANPLSTDRVKDVISHIYQLAKLPHKKMDPESLDNIFINGGKLLTELSLEK
jgi:molecular chaperone HtpG